jgi:hypothetical protein
MKNCLFGILLLVNLNLFSQEKGYVEYYNLVNRAEEEFVLKMDSSCFKYYDMAFAANKPFLKDPYIAAQIALYLNDTLRFNHYLAVAFQNGMPLKAVTASKFVQDRYYPKLYKSVATTYKRHYRQPEIDSVLLGTICMMCYESDSLKLKVGGESQAFYTSENETRAFLLESLLKKGVFANEHLLGITSNAMWTEFYKKFNRTDLYAGDGLTNQQYSEECELRLKCPMNILIHSQCFFRENKQLLFKAVQAGYLHPKDYGILEEISVLWFKESTTNPAEKCKRPTEIVPYNIFGFDPTRKIQTFDGSAEGIKRADANRMRIYMQKYNIDRLKKGLEEKYGFAFFFDFLDRP